MKKIFLLLFVVNCQYCYCQSKNTTAFPTQLSTMDTVLYLFFQPECDRKVTYGEYLNEGGSPNKEKMVIEYTFHSVPSIYDQHPLHLISTERQPYVPTKIKKLRRKNFVTVGQLADFITANYSQFPSGHIAGYCGASYFDNLQQIYIVERTDRKNLILLIKVKVYIDKWVP